MSKAELGAVEAFCVRHGVSTPFEMERIRAGRNSEVWRLFSAEGQWVLKHYYRQASGGRDRLKAEFDFLVFLDCVGVRSVARPLGVDHRSDRALYTFLPGARPTTVASIHVAQAAAFVRRINEWRSDPMAKALSTASEACFSLTDHLDLVDRRLDRLLASSRERGFNDAVRAFLHERVSRVWGRINRQLRDREAPTPFQHAIPLDSMILSPSDFGFHNALEHDGNLSFVDFEYAGWDDPAKLICDFICQPEVPVSEAQGRAFLTALLGQFPDPSPIEQRMWKVLPVHRLKWVCILLNEFRSEVRLRRLHAGVDDTGLLATQFTKAQHYFDQHLSYLS